jgi:hypothetical protein
MGIDALEVWVIAGLLVDEFGSGARVVARERANQALSAGDSANHDVWRAVGKAAEAYLAPLTEAERRH